MTAYQTPAWSNGTSPAIDATALTNLGQAVELAEHPYGVYTGSANSVQKNVYINFSGTLTLFTGLTVRVKFTNGNTNAAPTLSVNDTDPKPIKSYGGIASPSWPAGQILTLTYDGTNWLYSGIDAYTKQETFTSATGTLIGDFATSVPTTPDGALSAIATFLGKGAQIARGSYTGNGNFGSSNKNSLSFTFDPMLVIVSASTGFECTSSYGWTGGFVWMMGQSSAPVYTGVTGQERDAIVFSNSGFNLSWYGMTALAQSNVNATTYSWVALGHTYY